MGSDAAPFPGKATITLTGSREGPQLAGFGGKVLAVERGTALLRGRARSPSFTVLARTAEIGDNNITVVGQVDWMPGGGLGRTEAGLGLGLGLT